jgi:hypothetical protein
MEGFPIKSLYNALKYPRLDLKISGKCPEEKKPNRFGQICPNNISDLSTSGWKKVREFEIFAF